MSLKDYVNNVKILQKFLRSSHEFSSSLRHKPLIWIPADKRDLKLERLKYDVYSFITLFIYSLFILTSFSFDVPMDIILCQ